MAVLGVDVNNSGYEEINLFGQDVKVGLYDLVVYDASVEAERGVACVIDDNVPCTPHLDAAMAEKTTCKEQPQAMHHLRPLRRVDKRYVEHAVVGHGAGGLTVAVRRTYAHGHGGGGMLFATHAEVQVKVQALEEQKQCRGEIG